MPLSFSNLRVTTLLNTPQTSRHSLIGSRGGGGGYTELSASSLQIPGSVTLGDDDDDSEFIDGSARFNTSALTLNMDSDAYDTPHTRRSVAGSEANTPAARSVKRGGVPPRPTPGVKMMSEIAGGDSGRFGPTGGGGPVSVVAMLSPLKPLRLQGVSPQPMNTPITIGASPLMALARMGPGGGVEGVGMGTPLLAGEHSGGRVTVAWFRMACCPVCVFWGLCSRWWCVVMVARCQ